MTIYYHRELQSSVFKRHLCLIIYEYGPTKEPVLLEPTTPPSLHPYHHTRLQRSELYSPESSRENQLPSITNADEKSTLSGAA